MKKVIAAILLATSLSANAISYNEYLTIDSPGKINYVMGVIDGLVVMGAKCGTNGTTYFQGQAIFEKYANEHPELWAYSVADLYTTAVISAFHCEAQNSTKQSKSMVKF